MYTLCSYVCNAYSIMWLTVYDNIGKIRVADSTSIASLTPVAASIPRLYINES